MSRFRPSGPQDGSANTIDYRDAFLSHVHELLQLGYESLRDESHFGSDEEKITGELVREIEVILDEPPSAVDGWCHHYFVSEEKRENTGGRTGKSRKRVDIYFQASHTTPRSNFRFEAKRLGASHTTANYFGPMG